MTSMPIMRTGVAAVILTAAVVVRGCSSQPGAKIATTQQSMVPAASSPYTGVYSGDEWYETLDATMTSDQGGGGD